MCSCLRHFNSGWGAWGTWPCAPHDPPPPPTLFTPQGVNMQDRKRIFAWFAHKGLPRRGAPGAHLHPSTHSVAYRLRLLALLCGWTSWCFMTAAARRSWGMVMHLFGPVMLDDL